MTQHQEPYTCTLDPDTKTNVKMYLFQNVQNVEEIRNNVVKGVWNCSVIKPSLILDPFQVVIAANRAVIAEKSKTMVTRRVHTEILYNLSLTSSISQSLSKFGIEKENNLLICFLVTPETDNSEEIVSKINGDVCPMSDLNRFTNMKDLKIVYELNNLKSNDDLLDIIVSRMVTKKL